ncbi:hypothetical protein AFLA_002574 [Aspergillus flavus NRRL3357]|nr:hypothetical protein AFLA_002574 [Aspergillus flavus NRRL3357]
MTKGCYTCRRRRIICDNGLPTCRKCRDAGKECLGYQKPLVWVKGGVASRGKMMGRSFDDVAQNTSDRSSEDDSNAAADPPPPEVGAQGQDSLDTVGKQFRLDYSRDEHFRGGSCSHAAGHG